MTPSLSTVCTRTKAEPLFEKALEIRQYIPSLEYPETATSLNELATLYQEMGDYAKAESLSKEALEIHQKALRKCLVFLFWLFAAITGNLTKFFESYFSQKISGRPSQMRRFMHQCTSYFFRVTLL
jgi:tetratricopeptide (TPR) repeat protein